MTTTTGGTRRTAATLASVAALAAAVGAGQEAQAQGSGFVLDEQGHVVTNQHVVDGATAVSVELWDGAVYEAEIVGVDPSTDLAVLRLDAPASALEPLALGDSESLRVGETVIALGSPFGLDATVTTGIVSALHREIEAPNGFAILDAIQTDAAINHGNSGGPLLDLTGAVVGVNAQIESESGGNDGVGFAIPSSTVSSIASRLIADGSVEHAYLGVSVQTIPSTAAAALDTAAGVAVRSVEPESPADDAGLRSAAGTATVVGRAYPTGGDVIVTLGGREITSDTQLRRLIDAHAPGDVIRLGIVRDGRRIDVDVTLAARPSSA